MTIAVETGVAVEVVLRRATLADRAALVCFYRSFEPKGDARGRGIGRRLLNEVVAEARRLGMRRIWGIAEPNNVAMLRLARSCGFVPGVEPGEFILELKDRPTRRPAHQRAA